MILKSIETLRKHPISPEITRTTTKCYTVSDMRFTIPVGINIRIPTLAIHHDPDIYVSPELFIPERFPVMKYRKDILAHIWFLETDHAIVLL